VRSSKNKPGFSALTKNSLHFVPMEGGRTTIRAEEDDTERGHKVILTVEDNGIGIPADKMVNLFKKFCQINTTLPRKHGGTGLRLAIAKGIIESHGGTIWLSKGYTKGASFATSESAFLSMSVSPSLQELYHRKRKRHQN
jgi:signal transduction histidine kinase